MQGVRQRRGFMLALMAIVATAAAAGCGSSGGTSTAQDTQLTQVQPTEVQPAQTQPTKTQPVTTTRPAAPQKFISRRYKFRVTLTKGWSEDDARVGWDGTTLQGIGSPAFANFTDPATDRTLVAAAAPVAKGTQLVQWRTAMVRAAPSVCSESSSTEKTTLGGEPALAWTSTCDDGYDVNKLAALHGRRGYMIFLPSKATNDNVEDRRIFESVRRSFRFTGS